MVTEPTCPQCGRALPLDAPQGVCPQCLLGLGMSPGTVGEAVTRPRDRPEGQGRFVPPAPAELERSFPELEVLELLGQGGMGAVYKVRQKLLDRVVALKVLPPEVGRDPAFAERFTREARALARLAHPHIVMVFEFGQKEDLYYFIMEYVDGVNLRKTLHEGRLAPQQALAIVPQICDALQYAHEEGVIHRDIKPENVLLDKRGRVKIADFGLAKLLGRPGTDWTLTGTRQVMGTPQYMAPEQLERPQEVDHRADIYSVGVVFYELLTGELPIGRFAPPSARAPVSAQLDEVVLRALEKEPQRRYQHASEVKTAVESISAGDFRPPPKPAPPRLVRVPFQINSVYANFATALGVARFDGQILELEFQVRDNLFRVVKSQTRRVGIPLSELISVRWEPRWRSGRVTLQVDRMASLESVPGSASGRVVLFIAREDIDDAIQFVRSIQQADPARLEDHDLAAGAGVQDGWSDTVAAQRVIVAGRRATQGPGAGLVWVGIINLVLFFPLMLLPWIILREPVIHTTSRPTVRISQNGVELPAEFPFGPDAVIVNNGVELRPPAPPRMPTASDTFHDATAAFLAVMIFALALEVSISALLILAGIKMRHVEAYGLAITGSVAAMVPLHPGFLLGIPLGIWSLVTLARREVRAAFHCVSQGLAEGPPPKPPQPLHEVQAPGDSTPEGWTAVSLADRSQGWLARIRRTVRGPALGMIISGVFCSLCTIVGLILGPMVLKDEIAQIESAVFAFQSLAQLAGGILLLTFRQRQLATACAWIAVLPLSPAWPISLPMGIWSLVALGNPQVRQAFDVVAEEFDF